MNTMFEVGKVYYSSGAWFRCTKRVLACVPNGYDVTFVSNEFPHEFSVRVTRDCDGDEIFGGERVVSSHYGHDFKSLREEKLVLNILMTYVPFVEANVRLINGKMSAIGYRLFKSETSGKWTILSDPNVSYFNSEMFGEFKTVKLAFDKLFTMVTNEWIEKQ